MNKTLLMLSWAHPVTAHSPLRIHLNIYKRVLHIFNMTSEQLGWSFKFCQRFLLGRTWQQTWLPMPTVDRLNWMTGSRADLRPPHISPSHAPIVRRWYGGRTGHALPEGKHRLLNNTCKTLNALNTIPISSYSLPCDPCFPWEPRSLAMSHNHTVTRSSSNQLIGEFIKCQSHHIRSLSASLAEQFNQFISQRSRDVKSIGACVFYNSK